VVGELISHLAVSWDLGRPQPSRSRGRRPSVPACALPPWWPRVRLRGNHGSRRRRAWTSSPARRSRRRAATSFPRWTPWRPRP